MKPRVGDSEGAFFGFECQDSKDMGDVANEGLYVGHTVGVSHLAVFGNE